MKKYYIYITTNLINDKKYIGQHYGELNDSYFGSGTLIKEALKKYGKKNFKKEILEVCSSYEELNIAERKWINYYNAVENVQFYNIAQGGFNSNPCAGRTLEEEQIRREKLSKASSGKNNYFYGKHFYKEQHPMYGKHHSKESKEKMRNAKAGSKAPTAKGLNIYDLNGNFIRSFETQKEFKIFLGLSPNGSTETLKKYILNNLPYHGYIVKYII